MGSWAVDHGSAMDSVDSDTRLDSKLAWQLDLDDGPGGNAVSSQVRCFD
jgi:hypothetical protein